MDVTLADTDLTPALRDALGRVAAGADAVRVLSVEGGYRLVVQGRVPACDRPRPAPPVWAPWSTSGATSPTSTRKTFGLRQADMDLLLDTHALFWAIYKPELLSEAAALAITASDNTTWATSASAQEIALKLAAGKWRAALDLLVHFEDRVVAAGFGHVVPMSTDYANLLRLPEVLEHRDPFDRLGPEPK